jgi:hypothetical protein
MLGAKWIFSGIIASVFVSCAMNPGMQTSQQVNPLQRFQTPYPKLSWTYKFGNQNAAVIYGHAAKASKLFSIFLRDTLTRSVERALNPNQSGYFAVEVNPGCYVLEIKKLQMAGNGFGGMHSQPQFEAVNVEGIAPVSFTAEAGKVYYLGHINVMNTGIEAQIKKGEADAWMKKAHKHFDSSKVATMLPE